MASVRIRSLDPRAPDAAQEIALVAQRMHLTLVEVLGEVRARALYDDAGLRARVHWHLDPAPGRRARVLLAEPVGDHDADGDHAARGDRDPSAATVVGHAFVRVEAVDGRDVGLFGTVYVDPRHRRRGVAAALLTDGEGWMRAQGVLEAVTFTDAANAPLQRLFEGRGYALERVDTEWVRLTGRL